MANLPYRVKIAYYLGRKSENQEATWLDRLICFFTDSKYSHVELIYEFDEETKIGKCWSSSPRDGGVRSTSIDFSTGHWEIFETQSIYSVEDCVDYISAYNGAKYDWLGALGAYIPAISGTWLRWFCVEIIGAAMAVAGSNRMTPEEFFQYNQLIGHSRII